MMFIYIFVSVIHELDENGDANEDLYYMHEDDTDIIRISELKDSNWYKNFIEESDSENYWDNHKYIKKELLSKDYKGEWVPDVFLVGVYKIDKSLNLFSEISDDFIEKFKNIDMLSDIDARVFDFHGINYGEEEKKEKVRTSEMMDKWTYDDYIKPIRELLIQELKSKIEDTIDEDILNDYEIRLEELELNKYEEEQKAED